MEQRVNNHASAILTLSAPVIAVALSGLGWFGYTVATNQSAMAARQVEMKRDIRDIKESLSQYQTKAAAKKNMRQLDARLERNESRIQRNQERIRRLDERVDDLEQK